MSTRVVVGVASEERIEPFLRLTETYYHDKPVNQASVVRWRHLEAPLGPSTTVELVDGEESVGRMWIRTHFWSIRGRVVRAANPVDFLIREDHRRFPSFISLFNGTMKEAQQRSSFVYHTSNPLTDDLYRKLMKLKPVTELDGAVMPIFPLGAVQAAGVIRTGAFGRAVDSVFAMLVRSLGWLSRLGGVRLGAPPPMEDQERVLAEFAAEETVCAARSRDHRDWRFRGAGPTVYQEHWVIRRGRPIGYLITSDRDVEALRACFVIDLVLPGKPSRLVRWSLWLQAAALAASRGRHAVFFLHNRSNTALAHLGSLPMVRIPRARLPQRMPVFIRPSKDVDPSIFEGVDFSCGYYVLSDFDMF